MIIIIINNDLKIILKPHAQLEPMNKISANFQNDLNDTVRRVAHTKYNIASEMLKND